MNFGMPAAICTGVQKFKSKFGGNSNGDYEEVSDQQQELQEDHAEEGKPQGQRNFLSQARYCDEDDLENHDEGWPGLLLRRLAVDHSGPMPI